MDSEQETDAGPGQVLDPEQAPNVEIYEGGKGVIVRGPGGRFLPGSKSPAPITRSNSHEFARKRREKAAARIRAAITDESKAIGLIQGRAGSAEAVGAAAGMLWAQVVLNDQAYPRDRLEAFLRLAAKGEVLGEGREQEQGPGPDTSALAALGREALAAFLAERERLRRAEGEE